MFIVIKIEWVFVEVYIYIGESLVGFLCFFNYIYKIYVIIWRIKKSIFLSFFFMGIVCCIELVWNFYGMFCFIIWKMEKDIIVIYIWKNKREFFVYYLKDVK